jgi:hypothetical protein
MNHADQQRLNEIRAKLRRLHGHKAWSAKQSAYADELTRELVNLDDGTDLEELKKIVK